MNWPDIWRCFKRVLSAVFTKEQIFDEDRVISTRNHETNNRPSSRIEFKGNKNHGESFWTLSGSGVSFMFEHPVNRRSPPWLKTLLPAHFHVIYDLRNEEMQRI